MVDEYDVAFERDAARLRQDVSETLASVDILAFTERYAPQANFLTRAALLQYSARGLVESAMESGDLAARLMALIEEIVALHASGQGKDVAGLRGQTLSRLRDYLGQRAPASEVVFKGVKLTKRFEHFQLDEVDIELRLGEITGVVGENAQGKTTLLRLVAGDLRQDAGELTYPAFGQTSQSIDWPRVKQQTAFVPQQLPDWRGSLRDTLHFEAALHGITGIDNQAAVEFIIERMGLRHYLETSWRNLSGGYRLRFALAKALVWKPRLLVLDEPLANLDLMAKSALMKDLRELAGSYTHPIAVVLSSHDIQNVESVCSRILFMRGGRSEYFGETHGAGRDYDSNEFELACDLPLAELQSRLAGTAIGSVKESHLQMLLVTAPTVSAAEVLGILLERQVEVRAFRNISQSVRRFFDRFS